MTEEQAAGAPLIEFERVRKAFGAAPPVLAEASFSVGRGQLVVLTGANGAGKSTVLKLITGWLAPDQGRVAVAGVEPARLRDVALSAMRRAIGVVPQDPHLLDDRNVLENVMLPALAEGVSRKAAAVRARSALVRVGLTEEGMMMPARLSAGARQRVALARALVNRPALLLADEPTALLDAAAAADLRQLLSQFAQTGMAVLVTSLGEPAPLPPNARRLRLAEGRIAE